MSEEDQPVEEMTDDKEVHTIKYADRLVLLDNYSLLITRLLSHANENNYLLMYKPMELFVDSEDGRLILQRWIRESVDDYFMIPLDKVMNVSTPNKMYHAVYTDYLEPTQPQVDPEEIPDEELTGIPDGAIAH